MALFFTKVPAIMSANYIGHRLLIISNNVLSTTRSNGKVIMSYFDNLPKEMIKQLYFSTELPSIPGYEYYQIHDKDIIRGLFNRSKRGRVITNVREDNYKVYQPNSNKVKTPLFRIARELLWAGKWKSRALLNWLDNYNPTDIFFVGGDSLFAFKICRFIQNRYNARLCLYITDDYVFQRENDSKIGSFRRRLISKQLRECLEHTDQFFTISSPMQKEYKKAFGKDSYLVTNMTDPLRDSSIETTDEYISLVYTGSLYYGRDKVLNSIGEAIKKYNETATKKALLKVFTNIKPSYQELGLIEIENASKYCGRLNREDLIVELNRSTILCIVESFEPDQIENTRFSLSTKVSEYMSVGKPILAIGPKGIGTIDYLEDVAVCVNDEQLIYDSLTKLLCSEEMQAEYAHRAFEKYKKFHEKGNIQDSFIARVFDDEAGK